jgi:hypothetical protein
MRLVVLLAVLGATLSAQVPLLPGQSADTDKHGGLKPLELKPWRFSPAPTSKDERQKIPLWKWKLWDFRAAPVLPARIPLTAKTDVPMTRQCAIPLTNVKVKDGDDAMIHLPFPSVAYTGRQVRVIPSCDEVGRY